MREVVVGVRGVEGRDEVGECAPGCDVAQGAEGAGTVDFWQADGAVAFAGAGVGVFFTAFAIVAGAGAWALVWWA